MLHHKKAADGRCSPNLRSADRPLLGGRAMVHLVIGITVSEDVSALINGTKSLLHPGKLGLSGLSLRKRVLNIPQTRKYFLLRPRGAAWPGQRHINNPA